MVKKKIFFVKCDLLDIELDGACAEVQLNKVLFYDIKLSFQHINSHGLWFGVVKLEHVQNFKI